MKNVTLSLLIGIIVVSSLAVFSPSLKNGFVNWDDMLYIHDNPMIRSLSLHNLKRMFGAYYVGNYQPLTLATYALEYQFYKFKPGGYHATNLFLHLINCVLVFWLIRQLTKNLGVAFLTGLLFGIHPLHVESVAWISSRKDVLYGCFFLGALIAYVRYVQAEKGKRYYAWSLMLYIFALLSKAMAITLPLVLLLVDYFLKRKADKRAVIDKLPFFLLSLAAGVNAVSAQYAAGTIRLHNIFHIPETAMIAGYSILFYFNKTLLPLQLSCLYPYVTTIDPALYAWCVVVVAMLCVLIALSLRYTRNLGFGSGFFLCTLFPAMQFVPLGQTLVADRYMYIPILGLLFLMAEGLWWLYHRLRFPAMARTASIVFLIAAAAFYGSLSFSRCKVWQDGLSLWNDVLRNYPFISTAYHNRGVELFNRGRYTESYMDFMSVLQLEDAPYDVYVSLANFHSIAQDYPKAIELAKRSVHIHPGYVKGHALLVDLYNKTGDSAQALLSAQKIIELSPREALGYSKLCGVYVAMGNHQGAIAACSRALEIEPESAVAHDTISKAYYAIGSHSLAIGHCRKAIELQGPAMPR